MYINNIDVKSKTGEGKYIQLNQVVRLVANTHRH